MKANLYRFLTLLFLLLAGLSQAAHAQSGFFEALPTNNARIQDPVAQNIKKLTYYTLKEAQLRRYLAGAPLEFTKGAVGIALQIPLPNGQVEIFEMFESPILSPTIAAQHPEIKTYAGRGRTHSEYSIRISLTPQGFNGIILGVDNDAAYYEKISKEQADQIYRVYFSKDAQRPKPIKTTDQGEKCGALDAPNAQTFQLSIPKGGRVAAGANDVGSVLRTFRLAMAANSEFVNQAVYGGDANNAFLGLVNYVNRIDAIYRKELSVSLILVTGLNAVFTNPTAYSNNDQSAMLNQNQANLDALIGNASYDIGHVLGYAGGSGGGVAVRPSVCDNVRKGKGVSGVGDGTYAAVFDDQLIAHEMGHQFNMSHSYNSVVPVCTTREPSTSVEPGSGATIMSYGFTCSDAGDNDDYEGSYKPFLSFHTINYDQATSYISSLSCFTSTPSGNAIPVITKISANATIPKSTPFRLTGKGTDGDSDPLLYSWEGTNNATMVPTASTLTDATQAPFFRSYTPVSDTTRTFPRLEAILDGTNTARGDKLPSVGVMTTHRLTVRDNNGGVTYGGVNVTIAGNSGPFLETTNLSGSYPGLSTQTITWDVANTPAAPVSCDKVNILLSTDGGFTFPIKLASDTPNDGSQCVTLPAVLTSTARIKVEGSGNIFFDISNANFSITAPAGQTVDILFLIDDTGSMSEEIAGVRNTLLALLNTIGSTARGSGCGLVYQLVTYKDVTNQRPPTTDLNEIRAQVSALVASGGGDCPEGSLEALNAVLDGVVDNGTIFHATDASPHDGTEGLRDIAVGKMKARGITFSTILSGDCISSASTARTFGPTAGQEPSIPYSDNHDTGRSGRTSAVDAGPLSAIDVFSFMARETGGVFAFLPEVNSGNPDFIQLYQNIGLNIALGAFQPTLTYVVPFKGPRGGVVALTVNATRTNFNASTTLAFDDPAVAVTNVSVVSPTQLVATVQISPGAGLGLKGLTATTALTGSGTETAAGVGVFLVVDAPAQPTVVSIAPSSGVQGSTMAVKVTGINTHWDNTSVLSLGSGIMVTNTVVKNGQELDATLVIGGAATVGYRNLTVTTGAEIATENEIGPFLVIGSDCVSPEFDISPAQKVFPAYSPTCATLSVSNVTNAGTGYGILWSTGSTSATIQVCPKETTTYTVSVTSPGGCATIKSVVVNAIDVRCGAGNSGIKMCYRGQEICVAPYLVPTYQRYGATLGSCVVNIPARIGVEAEKSEAVMILAMKAYPNPTRGLVTVEVQSIVAGEAQFEVMDISGRAIQQKTQQLIEGHNEVQFDLSTQAQGNYLIRCRDTLGREAVVRVNRQ